MVEIGSDPIGNRHQEVLDTPWGKYVWTESLQLVDFFETGKRTTAWTGYLTEPQNTLVGAVRCACRHLYKYTNPGTVSKRGA